MKPLLILPVMALFLASCGHTVTSRIDKNPEIYQQLSSKHQALVEQGRITRGMSKDAVFLAWGKPASTSKGENKKGLFERWDYTTLEPIYTNSFHGVYGRGFGRGLGYGRHRRGGFGYSTFSSGVHYIPRHSSSVDFRKGRVTDWYRGRSRRTGLYH